MFKKFFKKLSFVFYRLHLVFHRVANRNPDFTYYQVKKASSPLSSSGKIIQVNGNFVIGGTTQLIIDLIERSSRYTHKVVVPKHPRPLPYQPVEIKEFPIDNITGLSKYLEEEKPVLVHLHYWVRPMHRFRDFSIWYQAVFQVCSELKIPVLQNINVPTSPFSSPAVLHNVFVSNYVRDQFNEGDVPSSVIYPGTDLEHFKNEEGYQPVNSIGMVYRLDQDKLNAEAIDIFIEAVKRKPDLACYIIGDGFFLDIYKRKVRRAGMNRNFVFTGFVSYKDLPSIYKKIGLIIAPVHDESFGQVSVFAMGMGIPVAGYNTGAIPEILGEKRTLVEYGDIKGLAELSVSLINDPVQRREIGQQNLARAKKYFSVETMVREYESLYHYSLSGREILHDQA